MEVIINGIHANLRFSSAHMIPNTNFVEVFMDILIM